MKIKKMEGIIEAILFTMGESVELDKIASLTVCNRLWSWHGKYLSPMSPYC